MALFKPPIRNTLKFRNCPDCYLDISNPVLTKVVVPGQCDRHEVETGYPVLESATVITEVPLAAWLYHVGVDDTLTVLWQRITGGTDFSVAHSTNKQLRLVEMYRQALKDYLENFLASHSGKIYDVRGTDQKDLNPWPVIRAMQAEISSYQPPANGMDVLLTPRLEQLLSSDAEPTPSDPDVPSTPVYPVAPTRMG